MRNKFSNRYGYRPINIDISIRENAPDNLRFAVAQIAIDAGMLPSNIRDVICRVLMLAPNKDNWSEYPNIWDEAASYLNTCAWYNVYDVAEALYRRLADHFPDNSDAYKNDLNEFFVDNGIGWILRDNGIVYRGCEVFSETTVGTIKALEDAGRSMASREIHEALLDLSRRPLPDKTGAIQHVMAALECTARDVLRMPNPTLGALLPKLNLPKPLDTAIDKLWGYASEQARHVREGQDLHNLEVELVVSVACAVCTFLSKRDTGST